MKRCTQERESARKSRAGAANRPNDGGRDNFAKANIDLRKLALEALHPITKKLNGIYTTSRERPEKETSISNLVEMLIREASDNGNLVSSSIIGAEGMLIQRVIGQDVSRMGALALDCNNAYNDSDVFVDGLMFYPYLYRRHISLYPSICIATSIST